MPEIGKKCRELLVEGNLPEEVEQAIFEGHGYLVEKYGEAVSLAARSSATAEDLPKASFAGQQETFLNVRDRQNLVKACQRCMASLFTNRAIKYRADNGFEHMKVGLSVGVQLMVRADRACSGVMFTLDPDSGFGDVALIEGAWGLGENVVQGTVNTDEFLVYKPFIGKVKQPVISKKLGSKKKMMVYKDSGDEVLSRPEDAIENVGTPVELQQAYILDDREIVQMAEWGVVIQEHYDRHMDIEWQKMPKAGSCLFFRHGPKPCTARKAGQCLSKNTL